MCVGCELVWLCVCVGLCVCVAVCLGGCVCACESVWLSVCRIEKFTARRPKIKAPCHKLIVLSKLMRRVQS